jgi:hypothetical protein
MKKLLWLALLSGCGGTPVARYEPPKEFPDVSQLPARKELPDPLVMLDGRRVTSKEMWENERKPELRALFQHYMYGVLPPVPAKVTWTVERVDPNFFGGKATKKEVAIRVAPEPCPAINLLLLVPNRRPGPAPVFLGINFTGNHTLVADPGVAITGAWMRQGKGDEIAGNRATERGRGKNAGTFALEQSIDRGYAVATWYYGDGLPDKPDYQDGIYPHVVKVAGKELGPTDCGAIAFWAWTFHRCVDYLVTDRDLDGRRIAVTGHSRNGKASIVAAAFDERIALAIPHQAGCGGTAPSRCENPPGKTIHETVSKINTSFPHWFCGNFKKFNDQVERLPFDQNCLAALCAPRPVLFTNGVDDQWANPTGQFNMLRSASTVYELLGSKGLDAQEMPPLGKLVDSPVGYYIRTGPHVSDPDYWKIFLDFADKNLKAR